MSRLQVLSAKTIGKNFWNVGLRGLHKYLKSFGTKMFAININY